VDSGDESATYLGDVLSKTGEESLVCVGDVPIRELDHVSSGMPGEEIRDSGLRESHDALGELPGTPESNLTV
jgi:hypothetical protein